MRRVLLHALAVVAAAGALAGCGTSTPHAAGSGSPLQQALSYYPPGSPLVVVYATKPNPQAAAQASQLSQRDPLLGVARAELLSRLEQELGVNYDTQVKPLLGNPIVLGDAATSFQSARGNVLLAWVAKDASKLDALLHRIHGLTRSGAHDGASLYAGHGIELALHGPQLLLAGSAAVLDAALDRSAHGAGITQADYSSAVTGLAPGALAYVFGQLSGVLDTPRAARARQIPWVSALRSYGVAISMTAAGAGFQFRLDTSGATLSSAELPLAAGTTAPGLVTGLPVQAGLRDPTRIVDFVLAAERQVSPARYAAFVRHQAALKRRTGIDFMNLISQFSGDLIVDSDVKVSLLRAGVSDPATVTADLAKIASSGSALSSKLRLSPVGGGFYRVLHAQRADLLGVIGNQLVFAEAPLGGSPPTPAVLRRFAQAPAQPLAGAGGALSFRIDLGQLLTLARPTLAANPQVRLLLGMLGDLTGSVQATPQALTGTASFGVR